MTPYSSDDDAWLAKKNNFVLEESWKDVRVIRDFGHWMLHRGGEVIGKGLLMQVRMSLTWISVPETRAPRGETVRGALTHDCTSTRQSSCYSV